MTKSRMTKQGVRALDPIGHNGHQSTKTRCAHNFNGMSEVVGTRWIMEEGDYMEHEEPIYGHKCLLGCGETRRDA